MFLTYFDAKPVTPASLKRQQSSLAKYRRTVTKALAANDATTPEYALVHASNQSLHDLLADVAKQFKDINHLVLVGIGGSNLGTVAVHDALGEGKVKLSTLDTTAPNDIATLLKELKGQRNVKRIAICVISKSGGTAETLTNAGVLLNALAEKFGQKVYQQTLFIGDSGTPFMRTGTKLGVRTIAMPKIVGGRYSVTTEVGLVPLTLLGHDVDSYIDGIVAAQTEEYETLTAEAATRIYSYASKGFSHYNFFAFEKRLYNLGVWYRQLFAESLGKAKDKRGRAVKMGMVPTVSTPVELHSVGQLYLSGFPGIYTDFVTFDDDSVDYDIPKTGISKKYGRFTVAEVATAIYGGVVAAYQEKQLPYRSTIFDEDLTYSLGLFMAMRMREVMYVAKLMGVNAFDQPNVELYKDKTKTILKL